MLMDLRSPETPSEFSTGVCIIGSGAAGISLAEKLARAGTDIMILEGGGLRIEPREQDLVQGSSVGRPFVLNEGRYRVLGGTTSKWRGRCAALSPIDFEQRDWVPGSGWPITFSELAKYQRETEEYCGFAKPWTSDQIFYRSILGDLHCDQNVPIHPCVWRFAPTGRAAYQDWSTRLDPMLKQSKHMRVLLHANATGLIAAPDNGHIEAIEVRTLEGRIGRIFARHFVLACGGVDNARLLLNFADQTPGLFDAVNGSTGRYFMQHPKAVTARIEVERGMEIKLQRLLNLFLQPRGTQYELGFALSEATQRQQQLVNCSGHIRYEPGPNTGWRAMKALMSGDDPDTSAAEQVGRIIRDPRRMMRNAWRRLRGRPSLVPSPVATLVTELEQVPDRESRIFLDHERDPLGLRRACADWRISEQETRTALRFTQFVDAVFRHARWGRLTIDYDLATRGSISDEALLESYHHIGATRMSADGTSGVVDANCTVHGIDNLHIAGASVMPTGGHVNPTFTLVSLALRLADHLQLLGARL